MLTIPADKLDPTVRIANHHPEIPTERQYWGPRTIPDMQLVYVRHGHLLYERSECPTLEVVDGHVLWVPPGEVHTIRGANREPASVSCIHGELWPEGNWLSGDYRVEFMPKRVTDVRHIADMGRLFERCHEAFHSYGKYREARARAIAREIWLLLAETWDGHSEHHLSPRMVRMIQYLRDHLVEQVTRQDLAGEFSLTAAHVNALFKRELGVTPTEFVNRERMLLAYRCLHDEGLSIKETAKHLGFCDEFYFSKLFKRIMQISPSRV